MHFCDIHVLTILTYLLLLMYTVGLNNTLVQLSNTITLNTGIKDNLTQIATVIS